MVLAAVLVFALAAPAEPPSPVAHFPFDRPDSTGFILTDARLVSGTDSVISGTGSLLADSRGSRIEWNEFLHTDHTVAFEPGGTYLVSFRYRIVADTPRDTRFYSLLRSRSGTGEDIYSHPWLFTRDAGTVDRIDRIFRIGVADDYYLILGIRGEGSIVIDDLSIRKIEPPGYPNPVPIRTHDTDIPQMSASLAQKRARQNLAELGSDYLVILCDEGAGKKAQDRRAEIMERLQPDYVDWSPFGPLAKEYGIRSSRGGTEYQEYYSFEGPEIWDRRYEVFANSGFVRSISNMILSDESWGEGGYFMCHEGPAWNAFFIKRLFELAGRHTAICQDNISCNSFDRIGGCFCEHCMSGFRKHLRERYSAEELSAWGVDNLDRFSARLYFLERALFGPDAWQDPVVREYIKYQYIAHLKAWAGVVQRIKHHADSEDRAIAVSGNQINADGNWVYALAVSQFNDAVEIEELTSVDLSEVELPPDALPEDLVGLETAFYPNITLTYKSGRASANHALPVYVRGPVDRSDIDRMPVFDTSFWKIHFAEALANGGVRDISLGINRPWTGDPSTLDYLDNPALFGLWAQYSSMVRQNRAVFARTGSEARVAVVYSFPTLMFRRFRPLDIGDPGLLEDFRRSASFLDAEQIPYDVLVFGHPEIRSDAAAFERLSRYRTIVLPSVLAMTDDQIREIEDFSRRGGKIITSGTPAVYDENMNRRTRPGLARVRMLKSTDLDGVRDALRASSPVSFSPPLPFGTTVNVRRSTEAPAIVVHLVDYRRTDLPMSARPPISRNRMRLQLPVDIEPDVCRMITMDGESVDLEFARKGRTVDVTLPSIGGYAAFVFADSHALSIANFQAEVRRQADREQVMREAKRWDLY